MEAELTAGGVSAEDAAYSIQTLPGGKRPANAPAVVPGEPAIPEPGAGSGPGFPITGVLMIVAGVSVSLISYLTAGPGCGGDPSCSGGPGSGNPFSTSIGGGATLSLGRQWSLSRGLGLGFELKAVGSLNSVSYQGGGNVYLTLLGAALLALTFG